MVSLPDLPSLVLEKIVELSHLKERWALSETCQVFKSIASSSKFVIHTITKAHLDLSFRVIRPFLERCDFNTLILKGDKSCEQPVLIEEDHVKEIAQCLPGLRNLTLQDVSIWIPNMSGTGVNILRRHLPSSIQNINLVRVEFLQEGYSAWKVRKYPQIWITTFTLQLFGRHDFRSFGVVEELPALKEIEVEAVHPLAVHDLAVGFTEVGGLAWWHTFGPWTLKFVDKFGKVLFEVPCTKAPRLQDEDIVVFLTELFAPVQEAQATGLLQGEVKKMKVKRPGNGATGSIVAYVL